MKLIFIDTETNGLPKDPNASYTNIDNWPRLVHLSWIVHDDTKEEVEEHDYIIKPNDFTIPSEMAKIHSITNEIAFKQGHDIEDVMSVFLEDIQSKPVLCQKGKIQYMDFLSPSAVVGHNISFDIHVIKSELYRLNLDDKFGSIPRLDTMILGKDYCNFVDSYGGYKYPTLSELYCKLFSRSFKGAHNSLVDVKATYACFGEMVRKGIIDKRDYTFLLSAKEKERIGKEYVRQAQNIKKHLSEGTKDEMLEYLYKAADIGNTSAMYMYALEMVNAKKYYKAKMWLEQILHAHDISLRNGDGKSVAEYKKALKSLIKIHEDLHRLHLQYIFKGYSILPEHPTDALEQFCIINAMEQFNESTNWDAIKKYKELITNENIRLRELKNHS